MAPTTSARNASPAPRAAKNIEQSKENECQNLIMNEHEQLLKKPQTTPKENVSQSPIQNDIVQEPQKQVPFATLQSKASSTLRATGRSLASAYSTGRSLMLGVVQRSKASLVETVSGISQRSYLAAFLVILIACMAFLIVHRTDIVGEITASVQKVISQAWSVTSQSLAGFTSKWSEASAEL